MKIRSIFPACLIVFVLMIGMNEPAFAECAMPPSTVNQSTIMLNTTDGFCLQSAGSNDLSVCFGAFLQTDYRYFTYDDVDPAKNKFDIRRAQLKVYGRYEDRFGYGFKYEFEGAGSRRLLDAFLNIDVSQDYMSIKVGQFKEPFGLDTSTADSDLFFAERSMGYYLAPNRDLGIMVHSSLADDRFWYGVGAFNGDGEDDATGGDEDALQLAGRIVAAPFKTGHSQFLKDLRFGGSLGYAKIDSNNVEITVKTTGLTTFFDVASRAKFNIIRDAGDVSLYGLELGWVYGPLALAAEYTAKTFQDVETSSATFDTDLKDYYFALAWMVTGENYALRQGVFQPVPIGEGSAAWGGLGLALRFDCFAADDRVYDNLINVGSSVRKATAWSLAANWYINRFTRLTLDATRTEFDDPLIIDRDPITGTILYDDAETVVTGRLSFDM